MGTPAINKAADKLFYSECSKHYSNIYLSSASSDTAGPAVFINSNLHMDKVNNERDLIVNNFISEVKDSGNTYLKNIPYKTLENKVIDIFDNLIPLHPEAFSFQPASENSIMFSFKKKTTIFYLEYYFNTKGLLDEALITGMQNRKVIVNYAGDLFGAFLQFYDSFYEKKKNIILRTFNPDVRTLSTNSIAKSESKADNLQFA